MSEQATEIDVAGATAALNERLSGSVREETIPVARDEATGKFTNKPEESATPAAGEAEEEAPATSSEESTAVEAAEEGAEPSFTHIPDEALSPELLAVKRSMQADYTRKQQEIAEYRKLTEEFGVETPDDLRARLELQRTLSDPDNWPRLHGELTEYLQSQGLSASVASEAAAVTLGQAAGEALSDDDAFVSDEDEEFEGFGAGLPPEVAQRLERMERQQQELLSTIQQREAQAQEEARFAEVARHLTTQENEIRASHKEWGDQADQYVEAVYDLSGDSADLSVGLSRLESLLGADAARYLSSKESALRAPTPVPGAGVVASPEEARPTTLEEGHAAAMEYVRRQAAAETGL